MQDRAQRASETPSREKSARGGARRAARTAEERQHQLMQRRLAEQQRRDFTAKRCQASADGQKGPGEEEL